MLSAARSSSRHLRAALPQPHRASNRSACPPCDIRRAAPSAHPPMAAPASSLRLERQPAPALAPYLSPVSFENHLLVATKTASAAPDLSSPPLAPPDAALLPK